MRVLPCLLVALLAPVPSASLHAQDTAEDAAKEDEGLTLERLFPEKRFFGPSARGAEFSHDGRYALWLWRPWLERRHGSDLWLHDFDSGETKRLTSVSVLAPFQEDTRKVQRDRIEKAKKKAAGEKKEETEGSEKKEEGKKAEVDRDLGDVVDEDDADDEEAPRYGGVSAFTWSPTAHEFLFSAGGDVYRWEVGTEAPGRLTRTRESESRVEYLPDGTGFTYQRAGALMRVLFGGHRVEQLDPKLGDGETLSSYELSPDGKKVVLLARKGENRFDGARTVNIADYGDRFMKVREVPRRVSDDPIPNSETVVYLYRLPEPMLDDGDLYRVHTHEGTGPRDELAMPNWSPDSTKVTFTKFTQSTGELQVFEAQFPEPESEGGSWADLVEKAKGDDADEKQDEKKEDEDDEEKDSTREETEDGPIDHPAKVVYRFLHTGGPTTPRMVDPQYLADSKRIVFLTELAGFRHLHVLDPIYEVLEPLTRGRFEVYPVDMPEHRRWMTVTATREHPSRLDVYKVDLENGGGMTRLSTGEGRYERPVVSPDGDRLLAQYSHYGGPSELVVETVSSGERAVLTDSHPEEAHALTKVAPELFEYDNRHGQRVHGLLFKPPGWKATDKRPMLLYVYGGPLGTRKEVIQGNYSGSTYFFARYMAEVHGYVTCTIDPRGMSGYGAVFEKANFERVGVPQTEDLVDGVKHLVDVAGVDPERVGMHGWSFGGFQTQMCLYTEPDVFACGIAGAGPTEWENYNSWYSTGTIGKTRVGTPDLEKYSLLPLAKNLKAKLLLVHGMEDSNVLYQDTVRVYAELLEAGKETLVELFLDPSGGHGLGGHVKALGRYRKYEEFLLRTLGTADDAKSKSDGAE